MSNEIKLNSANANEIFLLELNSVLFQVEADNTVILDAIPGDGLKGSDIKKPIGGSAAGFLTGSSSTGA